jgi:hypothetical protein
MWKIEDPAGDGTWRILKRSAKYTYGRAADNTVTFDDKR